MFFLFLFLFPQTKLGQFQIQILRYPESKGKRYQCSGKRTGGYFQEVPKIRIFAEKGISYVAHQESSVLH